MKINLKEFGFKIGHAQDLSRGTGITVILRDEGMGAGLNIAGGGPASRESALLSDLSEAQKIDAVVLSGGSAFGLDAAGGVQKYLEEHGIGLDTGVRLVPLVVQSGLFDLGVGDRMAAPDSAMAYQACKNAQTGDPDEEGSIGAGTGATIGKVLGDKSWMKSGIGTYAIKVGDLKVGAIIAVNAFGDVYEKGKEIAGAYVDGKLVSTFDLMLKNYKEHFGFVRGNTTIGCILTNADFDKARLNKVAQMAQDGIARAIVPVHTTMDGDSLYAVTTGEVKTDLNLTGAMAAYVTEKAIVRAVKNAQSLFGIPSYKEIFN